MWACLHRTRWMDLFQLTSWDGISRYVLTEHYTLCINGLDSAAKTWSVFSVTDWQPWSCKKLHHQFALSQLQQWKVSSSVSSDLLPLRTVLHLLLTLHFCPLCLPQTLMIRDWWMCMIISVMFEFLEYSLEHQLPNFSECWWDHVRTKHTSAPLVRLPKNQQVCPKAEEYEPLKDLII